MTLENGLRRVYTDKEVREMTTVAKMISCLEVYVLHGVDEPDLIPITSAQFEPQRNQEDKQKTPPKSSTTVKPKPEKLTPKRGPPPKPLNTPTRTSLRAPQPRKDSATSSIGATNAEPNPKTQSAPTETQSAPPHTSASTKIPTETTQTPGVFNPKPTPTPGVFNQTQPNPTPEVFNQTQPDPTPEVFNQTQPDPNTKEDYDFYDNRPDSPLPYDEHYEASGGDEVDNQGDGLIYDEEE
ncbi:extensin-like [Spinacia oleracea]|uniref:Extensin-like n=1 Tax=Spinacia oleracea TaxID=3562 RepID=A0ABM3RSL6_SPIOL|nr:extensin-like [Spinacia oleracea]